MLHLKKDTRLSPRATLGEVSILLFKVRLGLGKGQGVRAR